MRAPEMRPSTVFSKRSRSPARRSDSAARMRPASSAAAPKATAPGTFSVPGRRSRSWCPPNASGARRVPLRTYSAPTPFGAHSLWPLMLYRSAPSAVTSTGILPSACTPSTCSGTAASRAMRPISTIGWMVPSSLFACITEISTVSGRSAARTSSGFTTPADPTFTRVTATPSRSNCAHALSTAGCSMALVTTCFVAAWGGPGAERTAPNTARLSASVPPQVNTTSLESAWINAAT